MALDAQLRDGQHVRRGEAGRQHEGARVQVAVRGVDRLDPAAGGAEPEVLDAGGHLPAPRREDRGQALRVHVRLAPREQEPGAVERQARHQPADVARVEPPEARQRRQQRARRPRADEQPVEPAQPQLGPGLVRQRLVPGQAGAGELDEHRPLDVEVAVRAEHARGRAGRAGRQVVPLDQQHPAEAPCPARHRRGQPLRPAPHDEHVGAAVEGRGDARPERGALPRVELVEPHRGACRHAFMVPSPARPAAVSGDNGSW